MPFDQPTLKPQAPNANAMAHSTQITASAPLVLDTREFYPSDAPAT
jgi:hypothetical protein